MRLVLDKHPGFIAETVRLQSLEGFLSPPVAGGEINQCRGQGKAFEMALEIATIMESHGEIVKSFETRQKIASNNNLQKSRH